MDYQESTPAPAGSTQLPPDDVAPERPPPPPLPPAVPPRVAFVSAGLGLAGLLVLFLSVGILNAERNTLPWKDALVVVDESPPWDGMEPAWVRPLPHESLPAPSPLWEELDAAFQATEDGRMVLEFLDTENREQVLAIDTAIDTLEPMLTSGRLPEAGRPEVLAGDLARWDSITLDGIEFTVVGRLTRGTSALVFGYLIPYAPEFDALFRDSPDAQKAWFDRAGMARFVDMPQDEAMEILPEDAEIIGGMTRAPTSVVAANILGIALIVASAAGFHVWLFRWMTRLRIPIMGALFTAAAQWRRLFVAIHVVFYGLFIAVMIAGAAFPLANMLLMNVIQGIFREGHLQYVGDAYASGNIVMAAAATFYNNYVQQTFLYTLVASIFIPFVGLLKTAASFALTGFGMAPIWSATIQLLPFHSITIAIELEAYVIACFAVTLWPIYVVKAIVRRSAGSLAHGAAVMISTAAITAILLALAALYEATSLILLSFGT